MTRILVVTAVETERVAVLTGLGALGRAVDWRLGSLSAPDPRHDANRTKPSWPSSNDIFSHTKPDERPRLEPDGDQTSVDVAVGGVGMAAAAACGGAALAAAGALSRPYHLILSLGIGGAFVERASVGTAVIGTRSVAADLGARSPDGFLPVEKLGFGRNGYDADASLVAALTTALPDAVVGEILTVATVTGTAERTAELQAAHPDAIIEAMEGYGVAVAAESIGVPFVEVRTVSNLVGPRDRDGWRIEDALAALSAVGAAVGTLKG